MSMFAAPGTASDGFSVKDANGHLVVIEVHAHETGIVTSLGDKDAIRATVHDVDAGETHTDALLFPKVLIGSLRDRIGQKVLGRIGQGNAKPGQSAPWVLLDESGNPDSVAKATAYLTGAVAASLAAPAAPTVTPEAAGIDLSALSPEVLASLAALAGKQ